MRKFDTGRSMARLGFTLGATEKDEYHVACWLAALGFTPEGVLRLVEDRSHRLGHQHDPQPSWIEHAGEWLAIGRWLVFGTRTQPGRGWHRYRSAVKDLKRTGMPKLTPEDLNSYLEVVRCTGRATFKGRTAATDMSVLEALSATAKKAGRVNPGVSLRTIMKLANIASFDTVTKSLQRLQESGFIVRFSADTAEACRYLLRAPAEPGAVVIIQDLIKPQSVGLDNYCSTFDRMAPLSRPAFHRKALGPVRRRMLAVLAQGLDVTRNVDWRRFAGVSERQFYNLLPRLDGRDGTPPTVFRDGNRWRLVDDLEAALSRVAAHHGTDQSCRRRDEGHERQREDYRKYLTRNLPGRHQLHDAQSVVDTITGELSPLGRFVTPFGGVLGVASETPAPSVPSPPRDLRRNCEGCGHPTQHTEPVSGLALHLGCRIPHWNARRHRERGLVVPDHLVLYPTKPPGFDPYDLYPCERGRSLSRQSAA